MSKPLCSLFACARDATISRARCSVLIPTSSCPWPLPPGQNTTNGWAASWWWRGDSAPETTPWATHTMYGLPRTQSFRLLQAAYSRALHGFLASRPSSENPESRRLALAPSSSPRTSRLALDVAHAMSLARPSLRPHSLAGSALMRSDALQIPDLWCRLVALQRIIAPGWVLELPEQIPLSQDAQEAHLRPLPSCCSEPRTPVHGSSLQRRQATSFTRPAWPACLPAPARARRLADDRPPPLSAGLEGCTAASGLRSEEGQAGSDMQRSTFPPCRTTLQDSCVSFWSAFRSGRRRLRGPILPNHSHAEDALGFPMPRLSGHCTKRNFTKLASAQLPIQTAPPEPHTPYSRPRRTWTPSVTPARAFYPP